MPPPPHITCLPCELGSRTALRVGHLNHPERLHHVAGPLPGALDDEPQGGELAGAVGNQGRFAILLGEIIHPRAAPLERVLHRPRLPPGERRAETQVNLLAQGHRGRRVGIWHAQGGAYSPCDVRRRQRAEPRPLDHQVALHGTADVHHLHGGCPVSACQAKARGAQRKRSTSSQMASPSRSQSSHRSSQSAERASSWSMACSPALLSRTWTQRSALVMRSPSGQECHFLKAGTKSWDSRWPGWWEAGAGVRDTCKRREGVCGAEQAVVLCADWAAHAPATLVKCMSHGWPHRVKGNEYTGLYWALGHPRRRVRGGGDTARHAPKAHHTRTPALCGSAPAARCSGCGSPPGPQTASPPR